MENPRPEKVAVVDEVSQKLADADAVLLTEYRGLDVASLATLRRSLREAGGEYKVYKNTLVRFAAQRSGLAVDDLLTGPTAITFVNERADGTPGDAVTVAKALRDFARTNPNLVVKGGLLGGNVLTPADTTALAELPSREVLLARIAGGLAAPMQKFAGLLQALPRNMAYGIKALIDQKVAAGEEAPAAAPEPEAPAAEAEETPAPATEEPAPVEEAAEPEVEVQASAEGAETEVQASAEGAEEGETPDGD
jgi:large subunit ribosomal protein L10